VTELSGTENRPGHFNKGGSFMKAIYKAAMLGVSLGAIVAPGQVFAQSAPAAAAGEDEDKEIVVTGTLIRGAEVVGSQTITVDNAAITAKGATSTAELLSLVPQLTSSFNGRLEGDPRGFQGSGSSITKPNLRNLPSAGSTSGNLTLVLVDGMRQTPVGVNQASIDVDIIPASVLEGIDVVTDGGSSLYGADAVAGVLNFRTRRKFDGIKVDGNLGIGDTIKGYKDFDASIIAGKSWNGGNAYISVGHSERDLILNGETSWASGQVFNAAGVGSFSTTQCPSAVGTETRFFRFGPGAAQFTDNPRAPGAGTFPVGTACDGIASGTYLPKRTRTNVYGAVSQEFGENIDLRVTGYWSKRDITITNFPRGFTAAGSPLTTGALVGAAFPTAAVGSLTVVPGGTSFSFSPNSGYVNEPQRVGLKTWGISPELTVKFGGDWQVRTNVHYGRSTNDQSFPGVDAVAAQAAINAGQLNPRNVSAAAPTLIANLTNFANSQDTKHQLFMVRTVADGPLFALPGGDAKIAVGAEYQRNRASSRLNSGPFGSLDSVAFRSATQNVKAVFAEVSLPITTFADISASVRYDDYNDFGSTTNPNIGLTLKPTSWLKLFGHWNKSFNAPTAVDALVISTGRPVTGLYDVGSTDPARRPTDPLLRDTSRQGTAALVLQGSGPNIQPQTSENWAVGFTANPSSKVSFGVNYYSIDAKNLIGTLNPANLATYATNPDLYTYNVTPAQYAAILAQLTNGAVIGAQLASTNVALIVDTRTSNLNAAKLEGLDFNASWTIETKDSGNVVLGINGNRRTKILITNGGVRQDQLGNTGNAKLLMSWFAGWNVGGFSSKVTFNYTGKYQDAGTDFSGTFPTVETFLVTNLALGYDFSKSGGVLSGLALRVGIDNLTNEKPQRIGRLNTNNQSFANYTLGRIFKLGASFKF
jgi:iron complex outermembrane recepter protein